jgi:SAM-dependent methyltransferase
MTQNARTYGGSWADEYDEIFPPGPAADQAASWLADLFADLVGPDARAGAVALELAVGTGRVAIPLAERGIRVHGIDLEPSMIEVLHRKTPPPTLTAAVGDMTDAATFTAPDGIQHYQLVYCVFNSLYALPDGAAQRRALAAAATVLAPGGRLVLEMAMPDVTGFDAQGRRIRHLSAPGDGAWLETSRHDPLAQTITSDIVLWGEAGPRTQPVYARYVWPSELDLMAELAGLGLVHRQSGWGGAPFTAAPGIYVSVYESAG